jgi:hypothetical protein
MVRRSTEKFTLIYRIGSGLVEKIPPLNPAYLRMKKFKGEYASLLRRNSFCIVPSDETFDLLTIAAQWKGLLRNISPEAEEISDLIPFQNLFGSPTN